MKKNPKGASESVDPLEEATRLLDRGQMSAALQLLVPLHKLYPDDPEIALALGLASLRTNRVSRACHVFDDFVRRWPRHRKTEQIEQARADLAEARRQRLKILRFDEDDMEYAVAYEESNALLQSGQFAEARQLTEAILAERPGCHAARNNLSYMLWLDGDAEGALEQTEAVLADDPDNLQALCHQLRYRCLAGETSSLPTLAGRIRELPNDGPDACLSKMEAFSFLPDDAAITAIYEQAVEPGSSQDGGSPMLHHLAAVAHARQGHEDAARSLWHQALRISAEFELAKNNLDDAKARAADRHGAWPFSLSHWVAARDLKRLQETLQGAGQANIASAIGIWLAERGGVVALVRRLLERGDPVARDFALMLVTHAHTPEMDAALRDFAIGRDGNDRLRLNALGLAMDRGTLPREPVQVWLRGERHYTLPQAHTLAGEEKAKVAAQARALDEKLDAGKLDEAEKWIAEIGADTPLGLIGQARIQLARGETDEAARTLDIMLALPRFTRTELAALCEAQVHLREASGNRTAQRAWLDLWMQLRPDSPAALRWRKRLLG